MEWMQNYGWLFAAAGVIVLAAKAPWAKLLELLPKPKPLAPAIEPEPIALPKTVQDEDKIIEAVRHYLALRDYCHDDAQATETLLNLWRHLEPDAHVLLAMERLTAKPGKAVPS